MRTEHCWIDVSDIVGYTCFVCMNCGCVGGPCTRCSEIALEGCIFDDSGMLVYERECERDEH